MSLRLALRRSVLYACLSGCLHGAIWGSLWSGLWVLFNTETKAEPQAAKSSKKSKHKPTPKPQAKSSSKTSLKKDANAEPLKEDEQNNIEYTYIYDYTHQQELLNKNITARITPSSMTKIITALVIFQLLDKKQAHLEQEVFVSPKAWKQEGSRMFLEVNKTVPLATALQGILTVSANDACVAIAESLLGSEDNFVAEMNKLMVSIGCSNTHFKNCTGLPHPEHYSTLQDLLRIAIYLLNNYKHYYHLFSHKTLTHNKIKQYNPNNLLFSDPHIDGIKTGSTSLGKFGGVFTKQEEGRRVIVIVNGAPSKTARKLIVANHFNYAYKNFVVRKIYQPGEVIAKSKVLLGNLKEVELALKETCSLLLPKNLEVSARLDYRTPLVAPIGLDDVVGSLIIKVGEQDTRSFDVYSKQKVMVVPFIQRIFGYIKYMLMGT